MSAHEALGFLVLLLLKVHWEAYTEVGCYDLKKKSKIHLNPLSFY